MYMRLINTLAATAALALFATPAFAQSTPGTDTATAEARGLVLQPLTLTKVTDLDFGTILASTVAGTVTINADTGNRSVTGGITQVASNAGSRATFAGAGTPAQRVVLKLAPPTGNLLVSTSNVADTIAVSSMVFDTANTTTRTIGTDGTFLVGVGGTFAIAANQPNGLYKADFNVTADYQ
ncbi:DUF4402 domain-containing protein [Sphingomonas sp. LY29]|uniref:DUF4402 domain-containing protein n=1 Tax=Sphingomonas sp. LY29 TaxID=3095341 RepID=UPI002D774B7E|nr:DUF4402 domain-containing protein [Sphingomonas sp. LY29]WRP24879.1 DUF4402 domain-containing protein [Sphingomonas sp. LY29]